MGLLTVGRDGCGPTYCREGWVWAYLLQGGTGVGLLTVGRDRCGPTYCR